MVSDVTADYPLGLLHNKRGLGVEGGVNKTPLHFDLTYYGYELSKKQVFFHTQKKSRTRKIILIATILLVKKYLSSRSLKKNQQRTPKLTIRDTTLVGLKCMDPKLYFSEIVIQLDFILSYFCRKRSLIALNYVYNKL